MKKEKIVLAFVAAVIGLLVAGILFYIYESTRTVSTSKLQTNTSSNAEQTLPSNNIFLNLSKPTDESISDTKVVEIMGKTKSDATVVVLTSLDEKIVAPAADGTFSTTINIDDGENVIEITAIAKNGQEQKVIRTVTFSTEKF